MTTIGTPGELIAAVPGILGFRPERSLVLVTTIDGMMGPLLRMDLKTADQQLGQVVGVLARNGVETVTAIIVDGDLDPGELELLLSELELLLLADDIVMHETYMVDEIVEGVTWRDGTGHQGVVTSVYGSEVAAQSVLAGRSLVGTREELEAEIAVDPQRVQRVEQLIGTVPARYDIAALSALTDEAIAAFAPALTVGPVRDECYRLAVEQPSPVWVQIARALPDPWRAHALGIVAFAAYANSDGPRAGIALEAALKTDEVPTMVRLLDSALQAGLPPQKVRGMFGR